MGESEVPAGLTRHLSRVEQVEGHAAEGPKRQDRAVVREQRQHEEHHVPQECEALRGPTVAEQERKRPCHQCQLEHVRTHDLREDDRWWGRHQQGGGQQAGDGPPDGILPDDLPAALPEGEDGGRATHP